MKNQRFIKFVTEVCSQIKCMEVHHEIEEELLSHLEEIKEEYIHQGASLEEAERQAISHMGDSEKIGFDLNKVYKRKPEYKTVLISFCLIFFGLFLQSIMSRYLGINTFTRNIVYTLIGVFVGILMYLLDYRKLEKYSMHLFIGAIIFFIISMFSSTIVNGSKRIYILGTSFNGGFLILLLFIISLCNILPKLKDSAYGIFKIIGIYMIASFIFLVITEIPFFIMFSVIFMVLLIYIGISKKVIAAFIAIPAAIFKYTVLNNPYYFRRLTAFLNYMPTKDGMGYMNYTNHELLSSSTMFGKGISAEIVKTVPLINTEMIFCYIVYAFGWLAGGTILLLILAMLINLFKTLKYIKNSYGKMLMLSISVLFAMEFIIPILMNLNLAPIISISIPFIGYSGSLTVFNMALIGIVCSIYGRKNLSRSLMVSESK